RCRGIAEGVVRGPPDFEIARERQGGTEMNPRPAQAIDIAQERRALRTACYGLAGGAAGGAAGSGAAGAAGAAAAGGAASAGGASDFVSGAAADFFLCSALTRWCICTSAR